MHAQKKETEMYWAPDLDEYNWTVRMECYRRPGPSLDSLKVPYQSDT